MDKSIFACYSIGCKVHTEPKEKRKSKTGGIIMKLFAVKRTHKPIARSEYIKRCPCCGKTFKASYPASDFLSSAQARDIVNANYNAHMNMCAVMSKVS